MRAEIFISNTEGGNFEISVVKEGLSSGAARKYETVEQVRAVLIKLGLDPTLIDRQLQLLSTAPSSQLLNFPVAEVADDVLRSSGFTAAAFQAA